MTPTDLARAREELLANVRDGILPFWRERAVDREAGGYVTEFDGDGALRATEPDKLLVMHTRLIWCFSTFASLAPDRERVLDLAREGVAYLDEHFRDRRHGGWYWRLSRAGEPLDTTKHLYGHAFAMYGLAAFARETGDERAQTLVHDTAELIERHARDRRFGGYFEHFYDTWTRDGRAAGSRKTLDAHLHLLEALAEVYRLTGDQTHADRLREVIGIITRRMIGLGREPGGDQFSARFEPLRPIRMFQRAAPGPSLRVRLKKRIKSALGRPTGSRRPADLTSYGHSLELAWLLGDADRVLGDAGASDDVIAVLAKHSLRHGYDHVNGGIYMDGPSTEGPTETDKLFWPNAEALVGFLEAHRVTGDDAYLEAFLGTWRFARQHLVHPTLGEWRTRTTADGEVIDGALGGPWKNGYHTGRAALECVKRLDAMLAG